MSLPDDAHELARRIEQNGLCGLTPKEGWWIRETLVGLAADLAREREERAADDAFHRQTLEALADTVITRGAERERAEQAECETRKLADLNEMTWGLINRILGAGVHDWHQHQEKTILSLPAWLGLSMSEYAAWVEGGRPTEVMTYQHSDYST